MPPIRETSTKQYRSIATYFKRPTASQPAPQATAAEANTPTPVCTIKDCRTTNGFGSMPVAFKTTEDGKRRKVSGPSPSPPPAPDIEDVNGVQSHELTSSPSPSPPPSTPSTSASQPPAPIRTPSKSSQEATMTLQIRTSPTVVAEPPPTSSLTSLPSFNQSFASKRTVDSSGQEMVGDSGSDEDNDSLADVSDLLGPRPAAAKVQASQILGDEEKHTNNESTQYTTSVRLSTGKIITQTSPKREKKRKFSFATLLEQSKEASTVESKLALAKAELDADEERLKMRKKEVSMKDALRDSLQDVEHDDEDADRLWLAVERTEALQEEEVYHLFAKKAATLARIPFPDEAIPTEGWLSMLRKPANRRSIRQWQLVLRASSRQVMRPELLQWLLSETMHEDNGDLRRVYTSILSTAAHTPHEGKSSDAWDLYAGNMGVRSVLQQLGMSQSALEATRALRVARQPLQSPPRELHSSLWYIVDILAATSKTTASSLGLEILHLLTRMAMDYSVSLDQDLSIRIERAIVSVITSFTSSEYPAAIKSFATTAFRTVQTPTLQRKLISILPESSPRIHLLRRYLALVFTTRNPTLLSSSFANPRLTDHLILALDPDRNPVFRVRGKPDYSAISAMLEMLDVAVDIGFSDFSFLKEKAEREVMEREEKDRERADQLLAEELDAEIGLRTSPRTSRRASHVAPSTAVQSEDEQSDDTEDSPPPPPSLPQQEEAATTYPAQTIKSFNATLHPLLHALRHLSSHIRITGATNIRGCEAKATVEGVIARIEGSVLIGRRAVRDFFDTSGGDNGDIRGFFGGGREVEGDSWMNKAT